jgi:hypothetical protein
MTPSLRVSDLRAEPAAPQNVLLVAPITNCTLDSGGGQRSYHLYRALAQSHTVDILLVPQAGRVGEAAQPHVSRLGLDQTASL